MRAGEGEGRVVVIEHSSCPRSRRVTNLATRRESRSNVIGIRSASEVRLVARVAVCRCTREHVVDVARSAGHRYVGSCEREGRLVVIKYRSGPRGRRMAYLATGGESGGDVIGIRGAGVVGLVTGVAVCWRTRENIVDVARRAGHGCVGAGEREGRLVVIEYRPIPRCGVMARGAGCWESRGNVIWIRCAGVVGFVARVAIGRRALEDIVDMA